MASIDIYLTPKKYKDGTSPVMIRCTINRKNSYKQICRIKDSDWDFQKKRVKRSHPNQLHFNNLISNTFAEFEQKFLTTQIDKTNESSRTVLHQEKTKKPYLIETITQYILEQKKQAKYNTAEKYNTYFNNILAFLNNKNILLDDVNESWIYSYMEFCQAKSNGHNTIIRGVKFIKSIFLHAIKNDLTTNNPLKRVKLKYLPVARERLTKEEIDLLEALPLNDKPALFHARNTFLLQYYLLGSRISDVLSLKQSDINHNRVSFFQQKTGAAMSVLIHDKLQRILDFYKNADEEYLLPYMKAFKILTNQQKIKKILKKFPEQKEFILDLIKKKNENAKLPDSLEQTLYYDKIQSATTTINVNLKVLAKMIGTSKNISTHISRHTFASHADKVIADKRVISKALGHTKLTMTEVYLQDLRTDEIDESMNNVYK